MSLRVDIQKRLGSFHLRVSFETQGGMTALLGASGCGKSMTLKCIAGIQRPDAGRIVLNDRVLFDSEKHIDLPPQQRGVGYMFQNYALFPNMTVEQNIAVSLPRQERCRARELIREFHLEGQEKKYPRQLSGGQQQRTALARIFASRPGVLLLDEPFSALDEFLRWQMELELSERLKAFPGDVLLVSHSRDEVCRLCDAVCVLTEGRSEPMETVQELMQAPKTMSAALLSGCKNFSAMERVGERLVRCVDWGVTLRTAVDPRPEHTHVGIRAHYLHLTQEAGENCIPCTTEREINNVFSVIVMLRTPGGGLLRLELPKESWKSEKTVCLYAAPCDIMTLM